MKLAHDLDDLPPGDELNEVTPMAAQVGHDVGPARDRGVEAPGIVRVVEQPVLQEVAHESPDLAQVAPADAGGGLLDDRVVAIAKIDRRQCPPLPSQADELGRLGRVQRQGLLGEDVLPGQDGFPVEVEMDVVGRAVMDDLDLGVGEQSIRIRVNPPDAEPVAGPAGQIQIRIGHGRDFGFRNPRSISRWTTPM